MPIIGEILETDTIGAMIALEARKHVSEVTLLPNANLGADGALRGIVVDVEGGISPQLIGNHASRSYVAVKTELKGASAIVNKDIANMILSNIMPANCRLIEIGIDDEECIWVLAVMDANEYDFGNRLTIQKVGSKGYKSIIEKLYSEGEGIPLIEEVIRSLFGNYESIEIIMDNPNLVNYIDGSFVHFRNASMLNDEFQSGIILGSQSAGFGIVEGTGYYPTSCGTILNKELGRGTMDRQVRNREFDGVMSNAGYYETPTRYRNLDNILDGLPDIQFTTRVQPLVSIKQGDM